MSISQSISQPISRAVSQAISNQFGGGAVDTLVFHAIEPDPITYEMNGVLVGTGGLTEACTSTRYTPDHEDVFRPYGSTLPAYWKGRVVENLITPSQDLTHADWSYLTAGTGVQAVLTGSQTDPDGGSSAQRLQCDRGASDTTGDFSMRYQIATQPNGNNEIVTIWVKSNTESSQTFCMYNSSNLQLGGAEYTATTTWQRFDVKCGTSLSTTPTLVIGLRGGSNVGFSGGGQTCDLLVYGAQIEDAAGRADTDLPSEYVATTTAVVKKTYANVNGNSVASNVVTEAVGSAIAEAPYLYGSSAATNLITYSSDLTNAAWSSVASITTTYDQVGLAGAANTASLLDDSNAGGLSAEQEQITVANDSVTHVMRTFVKKDSDQTRFPEFNFQLTGGTAVALGLGFNTQTGATAARVDTGTNASEIRDAGDWWEILQSITNNSTGNVTVSMTIYCAISDTIGTTNNAATGSIIVGNVELYTNKTIAQVRGSSPIFTAGSSSTVNATDLIFDDANHSDTEGGWYCEHTASEYGTGGASSGLVGVGGSGRFFYTPGPSQMSSFDGTSVVNGPIVGGGLVSFGMHQHAVAYGDSSRRNNTDGAWGTAGSYDGAFDNAASKIHLLREADWSTTHIVQLLRNVRRYNEDYVTVQATIDGLMP